MLINGNHYRDTIRRGQSGTLYSMDGRGHHVNESSNEIMAFIPEPLIFDSLIRLPVKSLVRFQCVNRFWCSLISTSPFIYAHLNRSKASNDTCLLVSCILHGNLREGSCIEFFIIKNDMPAVLEYSVRVSSDLYLVLPSCNGLVCFYGAHGGGIHVCNPSTKNTVKLPDHSEASNTVSRLLSCGFGFDQETCTYKVMKISEQKDHFSDDFKIQVFTIGCNNSWRTIKYKAGSFQFPNRQPPVFADGFFYWISPYSSSSGFLIVSFDIRSETFGFIDPPETVSTKDSLMLCLQELGGKLCLVDINFELDPDNNKRIGIWLLLSVANTKHVWVQETILHPSEPLDATRPVAIRGREILLHGFIKEMGYLNWYDLQTRRFRQAETKGIRSPYFHISDHVESLVPLNGCILTD